MLINAVDAEESRIAVVENGVLLELHVEVANREAYLGNIYKGRVVNIEPSIGAAFVAFGGRSNGFLHASDVLPAYSRPDFQLADVIEGRARLTGDEGPDAVRAALADADDDDDDDAAGDAPPRRDDRRDRASAAGDDAAGDDADDGRVDGDDDGDRDDRTAVHAGAPAAREPAGDDAGHEAAAPGEGRKRRRRRRSRGGDRGEAPGDGDGDDATARGDDLDVAAGSDEDADGSAIEGAVDAAPATEGAGADDPGLAPRRQRRRRRRGGAGDAAPAGSADDPDDVEDEEEEQEDGEEEEADRHHGAARFLGDEQDDDQDDDQDDARDDDEHGAPRDERDRGESDADDDGDHGEDDRAGPRRDGSAGGDRAADDPDGESGGARGDRRARRARKKERTRTRVPIDQLVRKGQELIVQVTKEGIGAKGPTLTTFVSLPGRSLVMMPSLPKCGVSRKIDDHGERRRLKRIVKELDETGNGGVGFIVRTNGVDKSKADLQRDRDYLKKIWELIGQRVAVTRAPALLYQESDLVLKAMRDHFSPDIQEVVVDSKDVYLRIKDFCEKLMPHMAERVKLHELVTPLFHGYGIESEVEKLYQPKVELPNGGSIVIDQAEALVAIDVNSGRFKPGSDLDETAYRTNLEAIPEIVRQLRLRDLGGLIMIDFIDMSAEKHRRGVERKMVEALRGDRARIKVGKISPFGMLELTRQRVGPGLKHSVFTTCRHCSGSGLVRTVQSKSLAVLREVRALLNLKGYSILQVFVAPAVNDFLVNYKRRTILDLEEASGRSIVFKAEPSYPVDAVHYRFLTGDGQVARVAVPAGLGVSV